MDGATLEAGSVAGVKTVKNPISLARKVMQKTPHVMLIGQGADNFAKSIGLETVDASYFYTEHRYQQLQTIKAEELNQDTPIVALDHNVTPIEKKSGTVGAVALDKFGNLAAATSTGGTIALFANMAQRYEQ